MIDFAAYILVRALNKIMGLVPVPASLWLGRRVGDLAFFVNKKRRLVAYANLKAAFCAEKSPAELRRITKHVYRNMCQTFVEVLNLTKVNRAYVDKYVEVVNMDRIRDASASGRGTILLTAHFGDWELSSLVSSIEGFPIMVLAREQKMKRLNELLNRLRESNGCRVIRKGMDVKNIIKALRGKNIVGILSDQDAGKNGVFVDFFGRPTSHHAGPFEIAKHTDSLILPNFIVRTGGARHKLYLEEYIDFRQSNSADDVRENLQKFAKLLESYVRKYPAQWLWLHKRWKSTPLRSVLVLDDGKTGHLHQSLAVARELQRARATQGYRQEDTKIIVVDVKYRSGFSRGLLKFASIFVSWRVHGRPWLLKICLERKTYDALMRTYSEFVISCGSSIAPVNIFMSKENAAKNIVVMRPDIPMWQSKFDLAIIPRHDGIQTADNVVVTNLAPNLMDEEKLKRDAAALKIHAGLDPSDEFVGFFVGGDNPEFALTEEIAETVLNEIVKFCDRSGAFILASTSRRTPSAVEEVMHNKLKYKSACRFLVIANEKNYDFTVGGIMALSKVVVVSEESVSMISEAITAGRKVIVYRLAKKRDAVTKHENSVRALSDEGYVTIVKPEGLAAALENVWSQKNSAKTPDDAGRIFEAIRRLI